MLEKLSGTVAYAVVKCGGVLKGHIHHYPLPWGSLKYNATREAYETDVNLEQLRSGELDAGVFDWGARGLTYPQYWFLKEHRTHRAGGRHVGTGLMSALGQKQTFHSVRPMSALPPKADIQ
jgi:hypothetical protein